MQTSGSELKAVILAAGQQTISADGDPLLLHPLGDRRVLDYVVESALRSVDVDDLYVVVGYQGEKLQAHLGRGFQTVIQEDQLGTGHAVLQLKPLLADFEGDLLILYGDTPLFRPSSILGLLNRHRLRKAHLTLLSAVVNRPLPYGRIIRDAAGRIVDIIEEEEASPEIRDIVREYSPELNVGAYAVRAEDIFPVLETLPPSPLDGEYRLTDCAHRLIRSGLRVESHQIYDQDEVLGINTLDDLAQAEYILLKRLYRPRRREERNQIAFGTGGWRAIIGEGFTMHNVRRLAQALSNGIIRRGEEQRGVVIGFDRRFLADRAADAAAEVFAGNNIPVTLLAEDAPTPLITYATGLQNAAYGLAFTASHNPPEWNGLKVFNGDGSLLLTEETQQIEVETSSLSSADVVKIPLDLALEAGVVRHADFTNEYVDAVEALIDLDAIRKARLRVIVDPMYGTGQLTMGIVLTEARCHVTFIHERRNPLFGGRSPAPNLNALRMLSTHIREEARAYSQEARAYSQEARAYSQEARAYSQEARAYSQEARGYSRGGYDLGLATDGDADRIAIMDEQGEYVSTNDILLLLYYYLHQVRGERGGVVRNLATTHLLDRLAAHLGESCYEVPVGFKHIAAAMVEHDALLGGESSGGLTIRGHILGKDGIFAAALIVEMLARTSQKISELRGTVFDLVGRLYVVEDNIPATPEMRVVIPQCLAGTDITHISAWPVLGVSHLDGTKFHLENDNWLLLRFSGTEPVLRIFAEADSEDKAQEMIHCLKELVALSVE